MKTNKPLWAVVARGRATGYKRPTQNFVDAKFVYDTREEARQVARTMNQGWNRPGVLPSFYVARYVHRHFGDSNITR